MSPGRRLRVLHVGKFYPPDYLGGIETYTRNLCLQLHNEIDFRVVVSATGRKTVSEIIEGVAVTRLGTVAKIASAPISTGLIESLRTTDADILHFHLPHPTAVLAWALAGERARRLPMVCTYHSDIVRQRLVGAMLGPMHQRFLRSCAAIIVSSPDYLQSSAALQPHRDRCHVIPFGVDFPSGRDDSPEVTALRARYGPRMVLAIGRLVYYKGFEFLVRALAKVPNAKLVIIGEGPLRGPLETMIRELGLRDRIFLIGRVAATEPYYRACELFVLPSIARSEAFGIVQIEAMACGKPVINTQLASGVPYVSLNKVTGITVPPAHADALAAAIQTLLDDDALRHQLGEAARERATEEFSLQRMAARTRQIYTSIAASGAAFPLHASMGY
jgi:glycosyltransferase involved in cell wall biosynthesis